MNVRTVLVTLLALSLSLALAQNIRIMGYGGQDPAIVTRLLNEVIGDELEADGITLTYEPLEGDYNAALFNALSAGTAGDIVYIPVESAPGIIASGQIAPLNDLVDLSPFIETLLEPYTVDGQVYGIAKDFNTLAVFYNEDLFDEAGAEYPNEEDTWETLADKLRTVSDLGSDVYGACLPAAYDRFGAFAYAAGWQPFDEEGNTDLSAPGFREAMEWYTGLVQEGVAAVPSDIGQDWTGGCFATDNVGIAIEGAWILGFLRNEAPNLQFGTTFMPIGPAGERGNFIYTVAYGVNTRSPNQEAAVRVLEALTSTEAQEFILREGLAIPSRAELADDPFFSEETPESEANRIVFEGAGDGNVLGAQYGAVGPDWFLPINNALNAVMVGQSDPESAIASAQQEINTLIDRAR